MPTPVGQRHLRSLLHAVACLIGAEVLTSLGAAASENKLKAPETIKVEKDVVITPGRDRQIYVGIGEAKFMRFSCNGGPADVGISLSTFAEHADPLLFVSLNPDERPSFKRHDGSSFAQWEEDASGDHFVVARGVSPRGGRLGLYNNRHFAGEAVDGIISVHCSFIVAFDTFFWDHLRSSSICPTGGSPDDSSGQLVPVRGFCSGHGTCGKQGVCQCDEGHTGNACSHSLQDYGVAAEGKYNFQVATNRYQYFRVRVPPQFRGGYLKVTVSADKPLVVLLRSDGLPTKRNYKLSNFDDWMAERRNSVLKFKVEAPGGGDSYQERARDHRRLQQRTRPTAEWMREGSVNSWGQLFRRARGNDTSFGTPFASDRTLNDGKRTGQNCPDTPALVFDSPECQSEEYRRCEQKCEKCVSCVQGSGDGGVGAGDEGEDGAEDPRCTSACSECVYSTCVRAFSACAGDMSCHGPQVDQCERSCGSCMTCFGDKDCGRCGCCLGCLPLAAKCSAAAKKAAEQNQFAFVGVFNHRRPGEPDERVTGFADIKLVEDAEFEEQEPPSSWIAALYNPFHDIKSLEFTQTEMYPAGEQYIYSLTLADQSEVDREVKLFRDRVTLLHVNMSGSDPSSMELQFKAGQKVSHVLSTRQRAPRSFFDFDQVHAVNGHKVHIEADGKPAIWCALFGAEDGFVQVSAQAIRPASSPFGWIMAVVVAVLLCVMMVTGTSCGSNRIFGEDCSTVADPAACGEAVASLVVEHNPEDVFLHRGGTMGDDGI